IQVAIRAAAQPDGATARAAACQAGGAEAKPGASAAGCSWKTDSRADDPRAQRPGSDSPGTGLLEGAQLVPDFALLREQGQYLGGDRDRRRHEADGALPDARRVQRQGA